MFVNSKSPRRSKLSPLVNPRTLSRASKAIAQLVTECMASDNPQRFATAERLCQVGQRLTRAVSVSVADHLDDQPRDGNYIVYNNANDMGEDQQGAGGIIMPALRPRNPGPLDPVRRKSHQPCPVFE